MLEVQKYLKSGKTLEDLKKDFQIRANLSGDGDLVVLNYTQGESPKGHPIVMECRGLVLEVGTWAIVSMAFKRFFNWGENLEITTPIADKVDYALTKIDGSLLSVFWYKDKWRMATRGTVDGTGSTGIGLDITFNKLFHVTVAQYPNFWQNVCSEYGYIFELVAPENKVVKAYSDRALYLIGLRDKRHGWKELPYSVMKGEAESLGVKCPAMISFKDLPTLAKMAAELKDLDEGYVCVDYREYPDGNFQRLKVKNPDYLAMARLKETGGKSVRALISLIWRNKDDEFVKLFPEFKTILKLLKDSWTLYTMGLKGYETEAFLKRETYSRKDFAKWALTTPNPRLMFELYDKKVDSFASMLTSMAEEKGDRYTGKYVLSCLQITALDIDKVFEEA